LKSGKIDFDILAAAPVLMGKLASIGEF